MVGGRLLVCELIWPTKSFRFGLPHLILSSLKATNNHSIDNTVATPGVLYDLRLQLATGRDTYVAFSDDSNSATSSR